MTDQQQWVMEEIEQMDEITTRRAANLIGYYRDGEKHASKVLSRMVKLGMIERVKPGLFIAAREKTEGAK